MNHTTIIKRVPRAVCGIFCALLMLCAPAGPAAFAAEAPPYAIPADALAAPRPKEENFGTVAVEDAAQVMEVVRQAEESGLLEGQPVCFDPTVDFAPDSTIQYYYDETILTICWKELIDGNTCSFVETKIADASQFRRKLAGDSFGSYEQYFASELAAASNAVVAMNADYYLFRDFGIVVYDGAVYRLNTGVYTGEYQKYNCVDTLFVTREGDFVFFRRGSETDEESLLQWLGENDVLFSIAFGPVLVDEGEVQRCDWYPVGEIDAGYSRAGIGQLDRLHYLYMSLNHSPQREARWTVNTFAEHFGEKGVRKAYCLDGGQTGEIVFQGEPFNYIDFGAERLVSDILYFATALPEE